MLIRIQYWKKQNFCPLPCKMTCYFCYCIELLMLKLVVHFLATAYFFECVLIIPLTDLLFWLFVFHKEPDIFLLLPFFLLSELSFFSLLWAWLAVGWLCCTVATDVSLCIWVFFGRCFCLLHICQHLCIWLWVLSIHLAREPLDHQLQLCFYRLS